MSLCSAPLLSLFFMDKKEILRQAEAEVMPYLQRYYDANSELLELLLTHSRHVALKTLECMDRRELPLEAVSVARAALLHDIGIVRCDAKKIYCCGTESYIRHGIIGRSMLEPEGLQAEAMVCERHTGSGITAEEIELGQMPLPVRDMVPLTMLEKLVCYADKFYSKSGNPNQAKTAEAIRVSLARFGSASMLRFDELHRLFG